jgi:hypothetical protein
VSHARADESVARRRQFCGRRPGPPAQAPGAGVDRAARSLYSVYSLEPAP